MTGKKVAAMEIATTVIMSDDGDSLSNTQIASSSPRADCLMQLGMFPSFSMSSCLKFPDSPTQAPILPRHFTVAVEAVAVAEGAPKGMQVKMAEILTLEVTVT